MRRRLSPAALRRLGSDAIPTQAAHLTHTPKDVMVSGPGCRVGGVGLWPDEGPSASAADVGREDAEAADMPTSGGLL